MKGLFTLALQHAQVREKHQPESCLGPALQLSLPGAPQRHTWGVLLHQAKPSQNYFELDVLWHVVMGTGNGFL